MNSFNDIQNQWDSKVNPELPENGLDIIYKKSKQIRVNQNITKIILIATIVILIAFFLYVSAYKNSEASMGLGLMIGSLIIRVVIELIYRFRSLNESNLNMLQYKERFIRYRKQRQLVGYILTPILFIAYIVGFIIMIPIFEKSLSAAMFNYVYYSSWILFIILGIIIIYDINREFKEIKELIALSGSDNPE